MAGKAKKFPETLYVYRDRDGEDSFFIVNENHEQTLSPGEFRKRVAVYTLDHMVDVCAHFTLHEPGK